MRQTFLDRYTNEPSIVMYTRLYPNLFPSEDCVDQTWFAEILHPIFQVARKMRGPAQGEATHAKMIMDPDDKTVFTRKVCEEKHVKQRPQFSLLRKIENALAIDAQRGRRVNPDLRDLWRFTRCTPLDSIQVVICGQDPYTAPGVADGLAFSIARGRPPSSLRNIFTAIHKQTGREAINKSGDLKGWAHQGVLLMNMIASSGDKPKSHAEYGWIELSSMILYAVCLRAECVLKRSLFVMAWGALTKKFIRGPATLDCEDCQQLWFQLRARWNVTGTKNKPKNIVVDYSFHNINTSIHPSPMAAAKQSLTTFSDNNHFLWCDRHVTPNIKW